MSKLGKYLETVKKGRGLGPGKGKEDGSGIGKGGRGDCLDKKDHSKPPLKKYKGGWKNREDMGVKPRSKKSKEK